MIENLTVKNIALIEDLSVDFTAGFNILTGETGAGKSILVGALGLLLGNKADPDLIRTGKDEAFVSALFSIPAHRQAKQWLSDHGIEAEEGTLLLRRTLKRQGRGAVFIQSTPVPLQDLSDLTDLLVDMHSQHEHQSLLKADNHRKLLDHYCRLDESVEQLTEKYNQLSELKEQESALLQSREQRDREIDYLSFAVNEIEAAKLSADEEAKLEADCRLASQAEKLFSHADKFNAAVNAPNGALALLREGLQAYQQVAAIDESRREGVDRFRSAYYELEDVASSLSALQDSIDFSPAALDALQSRVAEIHRLTKKYGGSVSKTLDYARESQKRLHQLQHSETSLEALHGQMEALEGEIRQLALAVSAVRKEKATELEKAITRNLSVLGMGDARFAVEVSVRTLEGGKPGCGPYGIDRIQFLFSANLGEPLKELRSIASGGELSRVMLAVKSVFADLDPVSTLVFDEIDTGIGGAVALSVADYIAQLGQYKQILCITHLAQIAAKATAHYQIVKTTENGATRTQVFPLTGEGRVHEIARMLSGDSGTPISLDHARQMLRSRSDG